MAMRQVISAAIALIAMAMTGAAEAQTRRAPYTVNQPLNAYSWAGPYLGGNLGYTAGGVSRNPVEPAGFAGGVQGGYNWQAGQVVWGLEADLQATSAEGRFAPWKFSNPWFGTARGRIGFALENVLFYGTGGIALGGLRGELNGLSETRTSAGWTAGLGAEFGFTPEWSVKAEYLYVDLSSSRFTLTGTTNAYSFNVFRVGVNYRF